jgi:nucleotide-binding universal stress UspA family protein
MSVVVGIHEGAASRAALRWAHGAAFRLGSTLQVVTAVDPGPLLATGYGILVFDDPDFIDDLRRRQADIVESEVGPWFQPVDVSRQIEFGRPADVLVEQSAGADLLVIGRRRRRLPWPGSVARSCARSSRCPLVIVGDACSSVTPLGVPDRPEFSHAVRDLDRAMARRLPGRECRRSLHRRAP